MIVVSATTFLLLLSVFILFICFVTMIRQSKTINFYKEYSEQRTYKYMKFRRDVRGLLWNMQNQTEKVRGNIIFICGEYDILDNENGNNVAIDISNRLK